MLRFKFIKFRTCSDGCGPQWWPSRWRPKFFHNACVEHDRNYRTGMPQIVADDTFLKHMLLLAKEEAKRRSEAGVLFAAVAKYGHKFHPGEKDNG